MGINIARNDGIAGFGDLSAPLRIQAMDDQGDFDVWIGKQGHEGFD